MGKQGGRSYADRRAAQEPEPEEGAIEIVGEGYLYDYAELDKKVQDSLKEIVVAIRGRQKALMQDIMATGNQLRVAHTLLGHGKFQVWAQTEFDLSLGSINEFIHIAERFGEKPSIVEALSPTTARLLAGPTTSDEAIFEVVALYKKEGRTPLVREVKAIKERHKQIAIAMATDNVIDPADVAYELDAGYYAVVLEGGVWTRLREATRHKSFSEVLSRADLDQLALAIAAGLSEEVLPLGREMTTLSNQAPPLTFHGWLELMPQDDDLSGTLSVLRLAKVELDIVRATQRGVDDLVFSILPHLETLIERMAQRID